MAKARIGRVKDNDQAKFWLSLFDDLKKAVLADKISCPELWFHRDEAMYDRRLEEPIRQIIEELSWELKFRPYRDILESQVEDAAFRFLGKSQVPLEAWRIAFESDPRASVASRMQDIGGGKGRIIVHLSLSDELVEHDRRLKNEYAKGEELFTNLGDSRDKWDDIVLKEKMSFILVFFGLQAQSSIYKQWLSESWIQRFGAVTHLSELTRRWGRLGEIGISVKDAITAANFLKSNELLNIPYIDIFCSINAAIIKYHSDRKCKGSDLNDIAILATTLPYCDVVITDRFMKGIIVNDLQFDSKYKAKIFSAAKEDRLEFKNLVRKLSK